MKAIGGGYAHRFLMRPVEAKAATEFEAALGFGKGFALEATHLTDPNKLCTLLALLAFAVALTVKTGVARARLQAIPIKNHGRRAWSLFALGLHTLRKIFVAASPDQIIVFLDQILSPKLPIKSMRTLPFR